MNEGYTREQIEQMLHAKVKKLATDFTGNRVVSKYKDDKVFKYPIEEEDVLYFRKKFVELKGQKASLLTWYQLRAYVDEKIMRYESEGRKGNLLEAYLYALKLEDGCFASEIHGNNVNQEMLNSYENAIVQIYEKSEYRESFYEVMKHTLTNWEWCQPLLLAIVFFANNPKCGDEEIDEIMRSHLLFRKQFSKNTLMALCNRPSEENFEALLKFMTKYDNEDKITGTLFSPDNGMVNTFFETVNFPENRALKQHLAKLYQTTYKSRVNKAIRTKMDRTFGVQEETKNLAWGEKFKKYENCSSEEKDRILRDIRLNFRIDRKEMRDESVYVSHQDIMDIMSEKIEDTNFTNRCWSLIVMGKNKSEAAKNYLKRAESKYGGRKKEGFVYRVACYIQTNHPTLAEVCDEYFLDESLEYESQVSQNLKHAISFKRQSDLLNQYLEKLLKECKAGNYSQEKTDLLVRRLKHFFGNGSVIQMMFPVKEMKEFLKDKVDCALEEENYGVINDILVLIKFAATYFGGSQYENMLLKITANVGQNSSQFTTAKVILQQISGK